MKNIFFYLSPEKSFLERYQLMAEVQMDNSLQYWKPEDIIIVTNFPWEYKGIKSLVVGDEIHCSVLSHGKSLSNKPNVVIYLIEHGLVDEVNWIHDWDAFQLAPLDLPPLTKDIGFLDYGYMQRIQFGNIFFKPSSLDVWKDIAEGIYRYQKDEEETTNILINENYNGIKDRFQIMNTTYNIGMRRIKELIEKADKPLRIAHFPPYDPKYLNKFKHIVPPKLKDLLYAKFTDLYFSRKKV
jgi:hypothetical protein